MQLGNEYHIYDAAKTRWYRVNEFGERTDEITYSPSAASTILANGHAKLVPAKDVQFKQKEHWPKAWLWTESSFFFQYNENGPVMFYNLRIDNYLNTAHYDYERKPDDKFVPFNYKSKCYTKESRLVSSKNMSDFMSDVQSGKELSGWIKNGWVVKR
jgi:hypothetical protein